MQEDLLGYLLGALEPDEMRRVEQWLREDVEARRELIELERVLKRLEDADELEGNEFDIDELDGELPELIDAPPLDFVPPADLVARTLASLPPLPPWEDLAGAASLGNGVAVPANPDGSNIFTELSLSSSLEEGAGDAWNLRDWGVSITAVIILIAVAMPTLLEGRFAARKAACQNNLRELGLALTQFAGRNAQSRLPAVAADGHQAFAGIYTLWLDEAGLLDGPQQTFCPSIGPRGLETETWMPEASGYLSSRTPQSPPIFVTMQTLDEIERELAQAWDVLLVDPSAHWRVMQAIEKLRSFQINAGGHYAYNLGVCDEGRFSSPRFEGRSGFALMSDIAILRAEVANPLTTHDSTYRFYASGHGGRGINVLYEDGHVQFLPIESLDRIPDNPLINHDGLREAGVTVDDSSLGPSWHPPFPPASQR